MLNHERVKFYPAVDGVKIVFLKQYPNEETHLTVQVLDFRRKLFTVCTWAGTATCVWGTWLKCPC